MLMEAGRKHQVESREVYSVMNDLKTSGNPVWSRTMRDRHTYPNLLEVKKMMVNTNNLNYCFN